MIKTKLLKVSLTIIFSIVIIVYISGCTSADKSNINTEDPEKAFEIAMKSYNSKDYTQSVEDFSLIKIKFSGYKEIDKAQYYLGMSYFNRKEYILAAYEFENLLKNYAASEYQRDSRYMLAMCYYKTSPEYYLDQTYTKYAISEFQNYLILYPKDNRVPEVEAKIKELRNKLALKDFKSGELYVKMDRYKASLVYFDKVLTEYFDTDYADDALYNKIQVLVIRKKYDDAKKAILTFESRYKSSPYLAQVKNIKNLLPN